MSEVEAMSSTNDENSADCASLLLRTTWSVISEVSEPNTPLTCRRMSLSNMIVGCYERWRDGQICFASVDLQVSPPMFYDYE
nr:hypothetical protein [Segatella maculosa]